MANRVKSKVRKGSVTFEEFCLRVTEGQKADLLDGVIYLASPEDLAANNLFTWLLRLLGDFVEEQDLGRVNGPRVTFKLDEFNSPEPDIAFTRTDRLHLCRRVCFDGPPDVAVEIVSPDSVERDCDHKRRKYEEHGVPEYWIIDEHEKAVTFLRLGANGKYREVKPRKGEYHSEVIAGFWFRPEWLWEETRPKKSKALAEILERLGK